ncbi:glucoamylase family protein [Gramella sp. AN32]|uniref:Glucoamylase family protein n=1 Tax=Christiangramia antarctica TaxID=2058158 RepID=A0ABW5X210_9FLAO|nr:glucoamylase family protein [Gramella sp. AN32]MCM4157210.1 beta-glucosidase [Gramella sp. AN32]
MKYSGLVLSLGLFIVVSCSNNDGPGYQEPYIPGTDDVGETPPPDEEVETLTDDELLDLVQEKTFGYFWDFAEPNSGMARERSQDDAYGGDSPNIVTMGGSGFGIASFPAAVERGFISRADAVNRLEKILDFLESVPTYHGVYSHWYMGNTAQTRPFSTKDDGGDLVETAFLMEGLLINRQFFDDAGDQESGIRDRITAIWEAVEWDWHTKGENVLYWHWSPTYNFEINLPIKGWNESLIVYVLAASSPTHPITKEVYTEGWASSGSIVTNRSHYGFNMPLGPNYGGPLFFSHYSFIGLDPRNLSDQYANYWQQNTAHAMINYTYSVNNPKNYAGYGEDTWGLTASDSHEGYAAHSPTNDLGVITPTAALSSFPYTPDESMTALRHFYEDLGSKIWGTYGFYDAFSEEHNWYSNGYLAIDQGPIVGMIENYRTQLLWNLFMADEDVQGGLDKLGFTY